MGLLVTATCASCHGSHGIYRAADQRSTLFPGNVAATCGKCHRFIAERLKASIHGTGKGPGEMAERLAAGGKSRQHPTCTSCHPGHEIVMPGSELFPPPRAEPLRQLPRRPLQPLRHDRPRRTDEVGLPAGGQLLQLPRLPRHFGGHNPDSHVSPANRVKTCRQCHSQATAHFAGFDPHVNLPRSAVQPRRLLGLQGAVDVVVDHLRGLRAARRVWLLRGLVESSTKAGPRDWCPARPPTCSSCRCTAGRMPSCCCRFWGWP